MAAEMKRENEEGFKLEDYWFLLVSNWYWFLLSVIVALCIGILYIQSTPPVYTESTQLLIKEEDQGSSSSSVQDFKDLGLISSGTNINNEMLTISAPIMMEETARRLHLDLQLSVDESLHKVPLYNDAPISVAFPSGLPEDYEFSFRIKLSGNGQAELSHFVVEDNEEKEKTITARLGSVINTPAGRLRIDKTPSWNNDSLGRTIYVAKSPLKAVGALYYARLGVALSNKESTVINLTLTDESPDRAKDILLTLIDVYNEKWVKDKNRMAESTSKFISERLAAITAELGDVDSQISDYKSSNLLPDIQASLAKDMAQSGKNYEGLLQLTNQLSMAKYLREHMAKEKGKSDLLPSNTGIGDASGVETLISNYNRLMLDRISFVENSSENSPAVKDIDRQLASQRTAILRTLDNVIAQIGQQITGLQRSDRDINSQIASNPRQAKDLESVTRQQKVKESLYIFLLQKREENELSRTYTAWNTSIIQPPTGSELPTSPKKGIALLASLIIGLLVPGAIIFLRETMSHSVRGRADLNGMKTPLLGEIPDVYQKKHWWQRRKNAPRKVMISDGSQDLINESFRLIRTKLMYFIGNSGEKCKTIMLTSFNPASGKSFITANLGATLALSSARVLAIDLDLRHGSLSRMCTVSHATQKAGVSAFLGGLTDNVDELIIKSGIYEGVDLLPVGVIPPNPTELLMSPRMQQLVERLREEYDFIFFDCPPIEIVADASIVSKFADMSLFIVRAGLLDRRVLADIDELYEENKYNKLSIILNGTPYVKGKYGNYRYGYGYAYGYQYNYSRDYGRN